MMAHACNTSTWEITLGGSVVKASLSCITVQGQSGLYKTLFQKNEMRTSEMA